MSLATLSIRSAAPRLTPLNPYAGQTARQTTSYAPDYGSIVNAIPKSVSGSYAYTAAPSAAAKVSTAPSPSVDYEQQLADDQILQQQLVGINAQGTTNTGALTALRRGALANFGEIPDNLSGTLTGDVNADIDQTTRDLAGEATAGGVSTVAQLRKAYDQAQQTHLSDLAARGMLRSGALGQHANEDLAGYQQGGYQARQALLDYLTGAYQNYLGLQAQGQSAAADATGQALQRIIAQINAGLIGGTGSSGAGSATASPADTAAPQYVQDYAPADQQDRQAARAAARPYIPESVSGSYQYNPPKTPKTPKKKAAPISGYDVRSESSLH